MTKHLGSTIIFTAMLVATQGVAAETKGAGSTFVSPVMAKWIDAYRAKTGNNVSYQPVGSSIGVGLLKKATVDFGASDMPLAPKELEKLGMMQFPIVIGVVPVVNIEGVRPGQIHFTGQVLADIYLGKLRSWSDPAIRAINPDLALPNAPITVVHRIDGSGTTFNWSNYLSKVSSQWKTTVGEGTSVEWPVGLGGKGNDGVASLVSLVSGSIGYLEYAYALQRLDKISFGSVQNSAGNFVSPNEIVPGRSLERRLESGEGFLPCSDRCSRRGCISHHRHDIRADAQAAEVAGEIGNRDRFCSLVVGKRKSRPKCSTTFLCRPP